MKLRQMEIKSAPFGEVCFYCGSLFCPQISQDGVLFVAALCGEEFPDAVEMGVASRARRAGALEAVIAQGEGVEL